MVQGCRSDQNGRKIDRPVWSHCADCPLQLMAVPFRLDLNVEPIELENEPVIE